MGSYVKKFITLALACAITAQTTACGTIFYPERRGQSGGRIDPAVALMDGLGLLVFLIPGVIAFAVDFSTGAIYLPGSRRGDSGGPDGVRAVSLDGEIDPERLARIIAEETGKRVDLAQAQVREVEGVRPDTLVRLLNDGAQDQLAFN